MKGTRAFNRFKPSENDDKFETEAFSHMNEDDDANNSRQNKIKRFDSDDDLSGNEVKYH